MGIACGISTSDLKHLRHGSISFSCSGSVDVFQVSGLSKVANVTELMDFSRASSHFLLKPNDLVSVKGSTINFSGNTKKISIASDSVLFFKPKSTNSWFTVKSIKRYGAKGRAHPRYKGTLCVYRLNGKLAFALILDIDEYLHGVLNSEIPSSYHLEAIKAQAVAARTYSLNPRISHVKDRVNVCDSYLCCQYFGGINTRLSSRHKLAIEKTSHQVLTYQNRPILALFSSNAGGHTESYQNCFSDPATGQFPPQSIPYLTGVPEVRNPGNIDYGSEKRIKYLYHSASPGTVDSWSHHFKWSVQLTANQLEGHLHNNIAKLLAKKETAPFVVAPKSGKFGHVNDIVISKRGDSGSIIELVLKTSSGNWSVSKELVIRDLFVIPKAKIRRLKSARFYLAKSRSQNGNLSVIKIRGLGWGHGVGMQQTGAQGWAKAGLNYKQILGHYYRGTVLAKI